MNVAEEPKHNQRRVTAVILAVVIVIVGAFTGYMYSTEHSNNETIKGYVSVLPDSPPSKTDQFERSTLIFDPAERNKHRSCCTRI